ncbi:ArsO family NAD(P)H-dependent flavin-containing monooxygenase [Psychroserpens sp. S379A]|uniref:ArsO family NAD(P)H-dependent flavin-containing monooxygenase n=1 Tax=Psychroserpens sp. S379A TaxID=3415137 RepID=UPI003C7B50FC
MKLYDTLIIGGGQAGLSVAYFFRRHNIDYLILDANEKPGGSWLHTWDSLKLFSPTTYSSLSGWQMPQSEKDYPTKDEFISYLEQYETRYDFPVQRNTNVISVSKEHDVFKLTTNQGEFYSKTLVSATGTAQQPYIPKYPNQHLFKGLQLHSLNYQNANAIVGKRVLIIGGGNSGAQILAEVSKVAHTQWVTLEPPNFLPDDIDGRYLFNEATQTYLGKPQETSSGIKASLSNIVMVESVKEARARAVLHAKRPFTAFYEQGVLWNDNTKEPFDAVIWCTGFKANLKHLEPLNLIENNRIETQHTRAVKEPKLWLVGYGSWTGFASATIYGVGKTARQTVKEIIETL